MLARLADGDRSAGRPLFAAVWPPVRRLAGRMLPVDADAEDAAQDAMVTVIERLPDYDRTRPGLPWALTIARFACLTTRKARQRRRESPESPDVPLPGGDLAEEVEARAEAAAVMAALAALDERDRDALLDDGHGRVASPARRKRRQRARARARAALQRA